MSTRRYSPEEVEPKWQSTWQEEGLHGSDLASASKPFYTHVMFPYPSGDKLHVGHWYNFAPADSFARFKRMQGMDVFSPMGFDAFGLPAENYAIKTGVHPRESISENVQTMIRQLKRIGCMYDWDKMVNTSTPEYYRWTQWVFLQMFKNDLAYRKEASVNYCNSCQTVLANEQAQDGTCERCGTEVVQKPLEQWFWKTTSYAERLLEGLNNLNWPDRTLTMQRNWIGRSEGIQFKEKVKDLDIEFEVFDTVPQTYLAQTFTVIAAEHPLVPELVRGTEYEKPVMDCVERIRKKKISGRFDIETDMEGAFTGRYVENPFGMGDLPIWVASFVLADYGTGIVNCSAHDKRDFDFAKMYDIPLRTVMIPDDQVEAEKVRNQQYCYTKEPNGIIELPEKFKGRRWAEVREDIIQHIEDDGIGARKEQFRLRDWLVSRQRYWGAPIPIVYDPEGAPHPIPEEHLPWELPTDVEFKPTGTAPLAQSKELAERTEKLFGKGWRPEVDTMDTFVCSSFYSFRYLAEGNSEELIPKEIDKKWMPVDMYIGGAEHACMHLIYARFVSMALKDFGYTSHDEPYPTLVHQGTITNDGAKMSKSKNNVVSPDEFVETFGSDVFRMYLMFMGPFSDGGDWSDTGINGVSRFVNRIYALFENSGSFDAAEDDSQLLKLLHQTIEKVSADIEKMHFNTALSALMVFTNAALSAKRMSRETASAFLKILAPMAPHLAEELWRVDLGNSKSIFLESWPSYDVELAKVDEVEVAIQVNGKMRGKLRIAAGAEQDVVEKEAQEVEAVRKHLQGVDIARIIFVQDRIVNFIVR